MLVFVVYVHSTQRGVVLCLQAEEEVWGVAALAGAVQAGAAQGLSRPGCAGLAAAEGEAVRPLLQLPTRHPQSRHQGQSSWVDLSHRD